MAYRVEVGRKARAQLGELGATVGAAVERKIIWLAQNADVMIYPPAGWDAGGSGRLVQITSRRLAHSILDLSRAENCAYLPNSAPI